jgi:uncharacterized protein (UPF0276 family)
MTEAFADRVVRLPHLGIGVSTEYGAFAAEGSLDIAALHDVTPQYASFLELGIELRKGLDADAEAWLASGRPTTYHFLDINLDEPEDFDQLWVDQLVELTQRIRPAWLCGDAGLWHFGRRDRGHMLLLPPLPCADAADAMAEGIVRLREVTGLEILPENPPGTVYVGDMHLLDFFARVCEKADTGMLLDVAHLAIYQDLMGNSVLDGLANFPLDRVVEMHVAGGTRNEFQGFRYLEDSHRPVVSEDTWSALSAVASQAPNLRAVVFECERNAVDDCIPGFQRIERELAGTAFAAKLRT